MLTRIYIHNFRSFVNFELRPGRTGLLLGYNGTGKSSVFAVLNGIVGLVRGHCEASEAFPLDTLTLFGQTTQQRFELDFECSHGPIRYTLVIEHNREQEECVISQEEVSVRGEKLYWYSEGRANLAGDASSEFTGIPFPATRSFLGAMEKPEPGASPLGWLLSFMANTWFLKLNPQRTSELARKDDSELSFDGSNFPSWCRHLFLEQREQLEQAESSLREIMPGFRSLRLLVAGRARVLVAQFVTPGQKPHDIDFDDLSDGQRVLIILYVALHAMKTRGSLLWFDEPDNFVAIREIQPFMVELTKMCADHDQQALIISHSPEVIDSFTASEAILLERPDGGVTRVGELRTGTGLKLSELLARGWHAAR